DTVSVPISRRLEHRRIDAKLRDDSQPSSIAFGAPDRSCALRPRDGIINRSQCPAFPYRKGPRIASQNVFPAKKQRSRPRSPGSAQRMPCGDVIWLLVDVDNVWMDFSHAARRCRKIMQVEIAVEPNRLDQHPVPFDVGTFE